MAAVGAPRPDQRELDDEAMRGAWVCADSREAAESESGDVRLSGARVMAEIGEVLDGRAAPPPGSTVVFKSLGQAVEDAVAAELVWRAWQARGAPGR